MVDIIKKKNFENKIVAIVRGISKDNTLKTTVEAFLNGGTMLFEVTYNQESLSKEVKNTDLNLVQFLFLPYYKNTKRYKEFA